MRRRRRRTRRHRRNRLGRRVLLFVFGVGLAIGFSSLALSYLSSERPHRLLLRPHQFDPGLRAGDSTSALLRAQESAREIEDRAMYPYSIVPGGVKDAAELKWAAEHDPVVRAHYAGFDFDHARVVRLAMARSVYVSYRIGNKVYWMHHRISLKKGETIITDGTMIARTKCANRVEEVPQQATSDEEPPAAKFEEPMNPPTFANPPVPFVSALTSRNPLPGFGPAPPLTIFNPIGGGGLFPITPPPLPGVCGGQKKHPVQGKKQHLNPCGSGSGGEVPEPGTWLLVTAGLGCVWWMTRQRMARVSSRVSL